MAENKMAEVATMFGKELGEEFYIRNENDKFIAKFTELNFRIKYCEADHWRWDNDLLADLLTGRAVIVDE